MFEEERRGCAFPLHVGRGKVNADVAGTDSAIDGVGQGMQGYIGIRVPIETEFVGNAHAAEPYVITSLERVHVKAGADAGFHGQISRKNALGAGKVVGMGDLDIAAFAGDHGHAQSSPFGNLGIIGELAAGRSGTHMRRKDLAKTETLRGLGGKELVAILGGGDLLAIERTLDGVGDGQGG